jgi:hypothetical protein
VRIGHPGLAASPPPLVYPVGGALCAVPSGAQPCIDMAGTFCPAGHDREADVSQECRSDVATYQSVKAAVQRAAPGRVVLPQRSIATGGLRRRTRLGLDRLADRAEDLADLTAKEDQRDDRDDGD